MSDRSIRFDDGEAYEHFMGRWSTIAGTEFLRWLAPRPGLRWADIGCGNGAFTELLFSQAQAAHVEGMDPSAGQLQFARNRLHGYPATLHLGTATALPFAEASLDAAVMALVIFFVPEPEQGVAEMARVTRPGGTVAAYAWDIPGGGFPGEPLGQELRHFGIEPMRPPRADVSALPALERLWTGAGLQDVRTRVIEVERAFAGFDEWWSSIRRAPSASTTLDRLTAPELEQLQAGVRHRLQPDPDGRIRARARANAVTGTKAG